MQRINDDSQLYRSEVIFLSFYLIIMTVEMAVEYYSGQGITWALILFRSLSISTPLFALELLLRHSLISNTYRSAICVYFIFLFAWSVATYVYQNENASIFGATIYFAIPLGVSLENADSKDFKTPFRIICFIGIITFFFIWFTYNIDFSKAMRRYYTWSDIFFWGGVFWAIIPVILFTLVFSNTKSSWILAVAYWACGVIFYLIFVKRFIITDSILLLLMIGVFLLCEKKINARFFLSALIMAGIAILLVHQLADSVLGMLWEAVKGRFDNTTIAEFDRFEESRIYFSNSNLLYLLLGKGLWGAHSVLGVKNQALHVGWCNYIFKGGIILFMFAFIPTIKAFTLLPKMRELDPKTKWAVCMACVYGARLIYTNMHAHYPEMMMVFFSYTVIMNYKPYTEISSSQCRYVK